MIPIMKKSVYVISGLAILVLVAYVATVVFDAPKNDTGMSESVNFENMSEEEMLRARDRILGEYASVPGNVVFEEMPSVIGEPGKVDELFFTKLLEGYLEARYATKANGLVEVFALNPKNRFVRITDFRLTNGPDLRILLTSKKNSANADYLESDFVDLGKLKGTTGPQNYIIPGNVNLNDYDTLVIYSLAFKTVFAIADLSMSDNPSERY